MDTEGRSLGVDMMHNAIDMYSEEDSDFVDEEEGDFNFDEFEYEEDDYPL